MNSKFDDFNIIAFFGNKNRAHQILMNSGEDASVYDYNLYRSRYTRLFDILALNNNALIFIAWSIILIITNTIEDATANLESSALTTETQ